MRQLEGPWGRLLVLLLPCIIILLLGRYPLSQIMCVCYSHLTCPHGVVKMRENNEKESQYQRRQRITASSISMYSIDQSAASAKIQYISGRRHGSARNDVSTHQTKNDLMI